MRGGGGEAVETSTECQVCLADCLDSAGLEGAVARVCVLFVRCRLA